MAAASPERWAVATGLMLRIIYLFEFARIDVVIRRSV